MAGSYTTICLAFRGTTKLLQSSCTIIYTGYEKCNFSTSSTLLIFYIVAVLVSVKRCHVMVLFNFFLMTNEEEHLFNAYWLFLFGETCIQISCKLC
jgi:hypothetical protein